MSETAERSSQPRASLARALSRALRKQPSASSTSFALPPSSSSPFTRRSSASIHASPLVRAQSSASATVASAAPGSPALAWARARSER